jgi:carbamoyl-phosphate synthase large subunit
MKVLVTACGGGGVGEQLLKALLLANQNGETYEILGSDSAFKITETMDGWTKVPLVGALDSSYFESLIKICIEHSISALIPGSEPELVLLSRKRMELESLGIHLSANSPELIELCSDKFKLNTRLNELGFKTPRATLLSPETEQVDVDYFPVVVKPNTGGRGSTGVYIAQSSDELRALLGYLRFNSSGKDLLIQEYVGTPNSEFTIGVLTSVQGDLFGSIALRRNLTRSLSVKERVRNRGSKKIFGQDLVVSSGVSQGRIGPFRQICEQAEKIARALGSSGPLNIQGRWIQGSLYVFEINPRYSGTSYIRALSGLNEADLLLKSQLSNLSATRTVPSHYFEVERALSEHLSLPLEPEDD